jgi:virulence-associated protein VapD
MRRNKVNRDFDLLEATMEILGLTVTQATEYLMERQYNQMSHSQAMAEIKSKKWLWENNCPCCDNNPCLETLDAYNDHGDK